MRPARLLALAIAGEAVLVLVAVVWMGLRDIPIRLGAGGWPRGVVIGGLAAGGLAIVKLYLLCRAPAVPGVPAVCRLYRDTLRPLFGAIGLRDVVVISVAAGVGEELLFRGAVQPELGLVPASIIFGVLHMGGRGTVAFGCWVAVMGGVLGWLALWTEGLLAPIVAHTAYDAAALAYIRWGADCPAVGRAGES